MALGLSFLILLAVSWADLNCYRGLLEYTVSCFLGSEVGMDIPRRNDEVKFRVIEVLSIAGSL